jgi:hypothetical protein
VSQTRIDQNLARLTIIVLMDQNAAWQDPERTFDNAHILVQHQMMDIGAIEQRSDRRNQHDIVGPNQFPQFRLSFAARPTACTRLVNRIVPLPRSRAVSIVIK